VLLGSALAQWSRWRAVGITAVLFGLWHISPTLGTMDDNATTADLTTSTVGTVGVVAGSVLVTGIAGVVFAWLRLRSSSLVAPVLGHLGTNAIALVVAWVVAH
jgi:uncharacterized protein